MYGELDILDQQVEGPAAAAVHDLAAEHEARTGHRAARAQQIARVIQVLCLAQEPQRIARGYPVIAVVFRVAVACDDAVTVGKGLVHAAYVVLAEQVIRVKHHVRVENVAVFLEYLVNQKFQSIALAHLLGVEALVHRRAVSPRYLRRLIRAVVRDHEYPHEPRRIILRPYAVKQVTDDELLVPRRDQNRVAVQLGFLVRLLLFHERHKNVEKLIGIADKKYYADDEVD